MKCHLKIIFYFFLFVSSHAISGDLLEQSMDITLSVNIERPVCKLSDVMQTIDFEEINVSDITMGNVRKDTAFHFTDCNHVNNVMISFSGDNVDNTKNLIKNKAGGNNATGVAIKLYDGNHKEIQLNKHHTIPTDRNSFDFHVEASVVKENGSSSVVSAGKIDTSVILNIVYN